MKTISTPKPTQYISYGPLEVDLVTEIAGRLIDEETIRKRWRTDSRWRALAGKRGCYVFAFRAAKGWKPVYVGKAGKTFQQECFANHKVKKLQKALARQKKGRLYLFLIAGSRNRDLLDHMETMLIGYAYKRNPEIQNDRKRPVPTWNIRGVIEGGQGKPTIGESNLRRVLGVNK